MGDDEISYEEKLAIREKERKRAEDIANWPFSIPREIMDQILGDRTLGVREHIALAATCTALRRIYHNNHVFRVVVRHRFIPVDGVPRYARWESPRGEDHDLRYLATRPQKRKGNGPFMKPISETYLFHREAIEAARKHRITAAKAKQFYPNITDEHLSLLKYYPENRRGYPNQWTDEGYMESAVEWLSIRVRNGWALPGEPPARGAGTLDAVITTETAVETASGSVSRAKRKAEDAVDGAEIKSKVPRR